MNAKRILIVDDEESLTRMLKLNLELLGGYEVRTENSGLRAHFAASEFKPDLIILDIMMPDINGDEVAAQILDDEELKDTKIIFLTAIVNKQETNTDGSDIAGHTFIVKPVKIAGLMSCIAQQIAV